MTEILEYLLVPPSPVACSDVATFLRDTAPIRARFGAPIDRALASGYAADRLGFAFAAGYEAALAALVPALPPDAVASFCVTEAGGNHPRAITTRLDVAGAGGAVTGDKRWSTMAPLAEVLVVIAREGEDAAGRPRLRAVLVGAGAPGVRVREMPAPPFVPEVPHAELELRDVKVSAAELLPGDGYTDYVKPFRTVEDLHVQAGLLGYVLSVAARHGFPEDVRERLVTAAVTVRAVAALSPRRAETHVALAGLLSDVARVLTDIEPYWTRVGDSERERWYRDRALASVAGKAREQRRERAWEELSRRGKT
jgi:alkylation response protein AidB-like acyl-CoA dehydrogenase